MLVEGSFSYPKLFLTGPLWVTQVMSRGEGCVEQSAGCPWDKCLCVLPTTGDQREEKVKWRSWGSLVRPWFEIGVGKVMLDGL